MHCFLLFQESPDIPFQPARQPKQGLLKNKGDISVVSTPALDAAARKEAKKNTRLNGRTRVEQPSGAAFAKRMRAAQFFL